MLACVHRGRPTRNFLFYFIFLASPCGMWNFPHQGWNLRTPAVEMWNLNHWTTREVLSSVAQSCLTLCDPMHCSTLGFPVHHQLLELAQTHVHRVSDAIQPSHPLSSPSPPAPQSLPTSKSFPMSQLFA